MATKQRDFEMKTYLAIACLMFSKSLSVASTQVAVNIDKPTYLYVKSYFEKIGASQVTTWLQLDHQARQTFDESLNYKDGMSMSGSSHWNFNLGYDYNNSVFNMVDYLQSISMDKPRYVAAAGSSQWGSPNQTGTNIYNDIITGFINYCGNWNLTNVNTETNVTSNIPINFENDNISGQSVATRWLGGAIYTVSSSYRRTDQIIVKLKTGGKSTSKLRNLFCLNASAYLENTAGIETNWEGSEASGDLLDGLFSQFTAPLSWKMVPIYEYSNVPPQSISIGSYGSMVTNGGAGGWVGKKYLILPDGSDIDVTPNVIGYDNYAFYISSQPKYNSYFDIFVQQANPGYSLIFYNPTNDVGHAFWRFRTDAPSDALQYISQNLTGFIDQKWGFYPLNGLFNAPGILQNDNSHSSNIQRTFSIGFPDLLQGLEYTRGLSNAPPIYVLSAFNCVGATRGAGFATDVFGLPWDESPQNFGVMLIQMYPAPGQAVGPFIDTSDVFYSSAPY